MRQHLLKFWACRKYQQKQLKISILGQARRNKYGIWEKLEKALSLSQKYQHDQGGHIRLPLYHKSINIIKVEDTIWWMPWRSWNKGKDDLYSKGFQAPRTDELWELSEIDHWMANMSFEAIEILFCRQAELLQHNLLIQYTFKQTEGRLSQSY